MQAIDNEDVLVDGKRMPAKRGEIHFRDLFTEAIMENFEAASVIKKYAEEYFGPEAKGPSQAVFIVKSDGCSSPPRRNGRQRKKNLPPVSAGSLFRRVARQQCKLDGVRMTVWEAYVRQVYEMANQNKRAARLLQQLRQAFPGDAPPGDPNGQDARLAAARLYYGKAAPNFASLQARPPGQP